MTDKLSLIKINEEGTCKRYKSSYTKTANHSIRTAQIRLQKISVAKTQAVEVLITFTETSEFMWPFARKEPRTCAHVILPHHVEITMSVPDGC